MLETEFSSGSWLTALHWGVIGLVLLGVEIVTGTFVLMFFGVAALVLGLMKWIGLVDSLTIEMSLFGVLGLMGVALLRKRVLQAFHKKDATFQQDTHTRIRLSVSVAARQSGTVLYQGAPWTAFNESDVEIPQGSEAVIVRTEGIRLIIRPV